MWNQAIFEAQANWMDNLLKQGWSRSDQNYDSAVLLLNLLTEQGGIDKTFQDWALNHPESKEDFHMPHCSSSLQQDDGDNNDRFSPGGVYIQFVKTRIEPTELEAIFSEIVGNLLSLEDNQHTLGTSWLKQKVELALGGPTNEHSKIFLMYTGFSCNVDQRTKVESQYQKSGGNAQLVNLFWEAVRRQAPDAWKDVQRCNLVSDFRSNPAGKQDDACRFQTRHSLVLRYPVARMT